MTSEHILRYVTETPWAILPTKLAEILSVLATGQTFTPAETRARIGDHLSGLSRPLKRHGGVAVLPIRGVIDHRMGGMAEWTGGTSTEALSAMLRQAAADGSIGAIVLDVDSPGGSVPGLQELAAEIFALRGSKRIIAVANSVMASAAYWLASQADEIVSIPSGLVGSIGVVTAHQDMSAALEKEGVKITLVSYGKYKTENNPFQALTPEGLAQLQGRVNVAGDRFVADVARGRGVSISAVKNGFGEGRVLAATDARRLGLIDRIGTLDSVAAAVGGRLGTRETLGAHATAPDFDQAFVGRLLAPTADERRADEADAHEERARIARLL